AAVTVAVVAVAVSAMRDETAAAKVAVTVHEKVVEAAVARAPKAASAATPKAVAAKAAVKNVGHAATEVAVAANVTASAKVPANNRNWALWPRRP
ncbi:hypothetical protein, partial [Hydrogenophaga defluvii]